MALYINTVYHPHTMSLLRLSLELMAAQHGSFKVYTPLIIIHHHINIKHHSFYYSVFVPSLISNRHHIATAVHRFESSLKPPNGCTEQLPLLKPLSGCTAITALPLLHYRLLQSARTEGVDAAGSSCT
jgi:hypothetical protein